MKLKHLYIALGLSLLLTSCKDDEPVPVSSSSETVVSFNLALSSESQGTRAVGDVTDKDGNENWQNGADPEATEFDNRINSMKVVLYAVAGNTLNTDNPLGEMEVDPSSYTDDKDGSITVKGKLKTNIPASLLADPKTSYRLAVFINAPVTGTYGLDIKKPSQCVFNFHGTSEQFQGIPMYGVAKCYFTGLTNAEGTETSPFVIKGSSDGSSDLSIPVLRSMAKIKVRVHNDLYETVANGGREVRLKSIKINRHANRGFLVPKGWNTVDNFLSVNLKSVMNGFIGSDNYTDKECSYDAPETNPAESWKNSDQKLRFYIPDTFNCEHDGYDSEPIKLTLEYYTDGDYSDVRTDDIFLCRYTDDGKHDVNDANHQIWDIIRNHIYEFVIEGVEASFDLKVGVSVKKWEYEVIQTEL